MNVTKYNFFFGALENVVSIYNFNDNKKVVFGSAVFGDECTLIDKKTWKKYEKTGRKESSIVKKIYQKLYVYTKKNEWCRQI